MKTKEPTEVVGILYSHLVEICAALDRAAGYFAGHDLAEAYRTGSPTPRPSRIATQINKARDHAEGYLDVPEE